MKATNRFNNKYGFEYEGISFNNFLDIDLKTTFDMDISNDGCSSRIRQAVQNRVEGTESHQHTILKLISLSQNNLTIKGCVRVCVCK